MALSLSSKLEIGKYRGKGKTVQDVYNEDTSYLYWLRDAKRLGEPFYFDTEVHELLDLTLERDRYLASRFKPWNIVTSPVEDPKPAQLNIDHAQAYDDWGSF